MLTRRKKIHRLDYISAADSFFPPFVSASGFESANFFYRLLDGEKVVWGEVVYLFTLKLRV